MYNKEEGSRIFRSLMVDAVKSHDIAWSDAVKDLEKDPRYAEADKMLGGEGELKMLFVEHQADLESKRKRSFHSLLDGITDLRLDMTWSEIEDRVKEDVAFVRLCGANNTGDGARRYVAYLEDKVRYKYNIIIKIHKFTDT